MTTAGIHSTLIGLLFRSFWCLSSSIQPNKPGYLSEIASEPSRQSGTTSCDRHVFFVLRTFSQYPLLVLFRERFFMLLVHHEFDDFIHRLFFRFGLIVHKVQFPVLLQSRDHHCSITKTSGFCTFYSVGINFVVFAVVLFTRKGVSVWLLILTSDLAKNFKMKLLYICTSCCDLSCYRNRVWVHCRYLQCSFQHTFSTKSPCTRLCDRQTKLVSLIATWRLESSANPLFLEDAVSESFRMDPAIFPTCYHSCTHI